MRKSILVIICFLLFSSQAFAWDDICSMGGNMNSMTSVQAQKYYDDNIRGKMFSGRGRVRNVWEYGVNKYQAVKVDCGNDVIINVATTSHNLDNVNAGDTVSFDGKCIDGSRRLYVNTKEPYAHFELSEGSIR
jgi:hypothetical protein